MGRGFVLMGRPGIGKTTVVKRVVQALGERAGGFYTEEIREEGRRVGFRLVTLDGEETVMAHVDLRGGDRPRVSRYGVDVQAIEDVGVDAVQRALAQDRVVIIDEIGKMELFSAAFKDVVLEALDEADVVIATAMGGSHPWVDDVKGRDDVSVLQVTRQNRDELPERLLERVRGLRDFEAVQKPKCPSSPRQGSHAKTRQSPGVDEEPKTLSRPRRRLRTPLYRCDCPLLGSVDG